MQPQDEEGRQPAPPPQTREEPGAAPQHTDISDLLAEPLDGGPPSGGDSGDDGSQV